VQRELYAGNMTVIPLLKFAPNDTGNDLYRSWAKKLVGSGDVEGFLLAVPYAVSCSAVPPSTLLDAYWPKLSDKQKDDALSAIQKHISWKNPISEDAFQWFLRSFANGNVTPSGQGTALLAEFMALPSTRDRAINLLLTQYRHIPGESIAKLLDAAVDESEVNGACDQVCTADEHQDDRLKSQCKCDDEDSTVSSRLEPAVALFKAATQSHPQIALIALRTLASDDMGRDSANKLAAPIIKSPDSEFRKAVIVTLADNDMPLGTVHLEEVFKGAVPLHEPFGSIETFANPPATKLYEKLAGHGYGETGKTWPPSVSEDKSRATDPKIWRQFINEYPWFPGTDDAYYQLAYCQYAARDYKSSLRTIFEALNRDLSDKDAFPYILYLLKRIALKEQALNGEYPVLARIRVLGSDVLGVGIFDSNPNFEKLVSATDWFLSNEDQIRYLGTTEDRLLELKKLIALVTDGFPQDRFRRAADFLGGKKEMFPDLLYGDFVDVVRRNESEEDEPTHYGVTRAAHHASQILTKAALSKHYGRDFQDMDRWTLLHGALPAKLRRRLTFDEARNTLAGIDIRYIPGNLKEEHKKQFGPSDEEEQ
jgi:hypothetical protein